MIKKTTKTAISEQLDLFDYATAHAINLKILSNPQTPPVSDEVNNPEHYQSPAGIECIEAIRAALTPEEFRGYCKGNLIKYTWRERTKGGVTSMKKALWYATRLIAHDEG